MADRPPSRPTPLLLAAALLGVEALAALVFGGIALTQIRISRAELGAGVAIWMLGYGVLLLAIARGVFRGRRWSRAPAVATQLILLPDRVQLPRRADHLGGRCDRGVGGRHPRRGAAPTLDRGLRSALARPHPEPHWPEPVRPPPRWA